MLPPEISALRTPWPKPPPASISFSATDTPSATPTPVVPPTATEAATAATCALIEELSMAVTMTSPTLAAGPPNCDPAMSATALTPITLSAIEPPPATPTPVVPPMPAATAAA